MRTGRGGAAGLRPADSAVQEGHRRAAPRPGGRSPGPGSLPTRPRAAGPRPGGHPQPGPGRAGGRTGSGSAAGSGTGGASSGGRPPESPRSARRPASEASLARGGGPGRRVRGPAGGYPAGLLARTGTGRTGAGQSKPASSQSKRFSKLRRTSPTRRLNFTLLSVAFAISLIVGRLIQLARSRGTRS